MPAERDGLVSSITRSPGSHGSSGSHVAPTNHDNVLSVTNPPDQPIPSRNGRFREPRAAAGAAQPNFYGNHMNRRNTIDDKPLDYLSTSQGAFTTLD